MPPFARWPLWVLVLALFMVRGFGTRAAGAGFRLVPEKPTHDRWMYPFNFQPGVRPVAPTYGSFDPRFDTRDAQFLLGWDTASLLATNAGPSRYLLRKVRLTLTSVAPIAPNKPFVYDPTHDAYPTYLGTAPGAEPDPDPGRPIEVFGIGYRGGFDDATFLETSAYGAIGTITSGNVSIETRNAYAAMYDTNGVLVDIANNVGQRNTNWVGEPFEVRPWAVGTLADVTPGEEVPDAARMAFDLNLSDPLILGHLQRALHAGRLRLAISSLSPAGQSTAGGTGAGGSGAYPWWATKENLLYDAPRLEIEGILVSDEDADADGLPDDWEQFWWGSLTVAVAASGDSDGDGATDVAEFRAGTDPTRAASVLRVTGQALGADGRWTLEFPIESSRQYQVETSPDLAVWAAVPGATTYPQTGLARWVEETPATDGGAPRFLRVRATALTGP